VFLSLAVKYDILIADTVFGKNTGKKKPDLIRSGSLREEAILI